MPGTEAVSLLFRGARTASRALQSSVSRTRPVVARPTGPIKTSQAGSVRNVSTINSQNRVGRSHFSERVASLTRPEPLPQASGPATSRQLATAAQAQLVEAVPVEEFEEPCLVAIPVEEPEMPWHNYLPVADHVFKSPVYQMETANNFDEMKAFRQNVVRFTEGVVNEFLPGFIAECESELSAAEQRALTEFFGGKSLENLDLGNAKERNSVSIALEAEIETGRLSKNTLWSLFNLIYKIEQVRDKATIGATTEAKRTASMAQTMETNNAYGIVTLTPQDPATICQVLAEANSGKPLNQVETEAAEAEGVVEIFTEHPSISEKPEFTSHMDELKNPGNLFSNGEVRVDPDVKKRVTTALSNPHSYNAELNNNPRYHHGNATQTGNAAKHMATVARMYHSMIPQIDAYKQEAALYTGVSKQERARLETLNRLELGGKLYLNSAPIRHLVWKDGDRYPLSPVEAMAMAGQQFVSMSTTGILGVFEDATRNNPGEWRELLEEFTQISESLSASLSNLEAVEQSYNDTYKPEEGKSSLDFEISDDDTPFNQLLGGVARIRPWLDKLESVVQRGDCDARKLVATRVATSVCRVQTRYGASDRASTLNQIKTKNIDGSTFNTLNSFRLLEKFGLNTGHIMADWEHGAESDTRVIQNAHGGSKAPLIRLYEEGRIRNSVEEKLDDAHERIFAAIADCKSPEETRACMEALHKNGNITKGAASDTALRDGVVSTQVERQQNGAFAAVAQTTSDNVLKAYQEAHKEQAASISVASHWPSVVQKAVHNMNQVGASVVLQNKNALKGKIQVGMGCASGRCSGENLQDTIEKAFVQGPPDLQTHQPKTVTNHGGDEHNHQMALHSAVRTSGRVEYKREYTTPEDFVAGTVIGGLAGDAYRNTLEPDLVTAVSLATQREKVLTNVKKTGPRKNGGSQLDLGKRNGRAIGEHGATKLTPVTRAVLANSMVPETPYTLSMLGELQPGRYSSIRWVIERGLGPNCYSADGPSLLKQPTGVIIPEENKPAFSRFLSLVDGQTTAAGRVVTAWYRNDPTYYQDMQRHQAPEVIDKRTGRITDVKDVSARLEFHKSEVGTRSFLHAFALWQLGITDPSSGKWADVEECFLRVNSRYAR